MIKHPPAPQVRCDTAPLVAAAHRLPARDHRVAGADLETLRTMRGSVRRRQTPPVDRHNQTLNSHVRTIEIPIRKPTQRTVQTFVTTGVEVVDAPEPDRRLHLTIRLRAVVRVAVTGHHTIHQSGDDAPQTQPPSVIPWVGAPFVRLNVLGF